MASTTHVAAPGTKNLRRDRTHWLCVAVIVVAGTSIVVGLGAPDIGESLKPLGTGFVALIKMLISPIIVLGRIPTTLVSAFTDGNVLQTLFVAVLIGLAVQSLGRRGEPIQRGVGIGALVLLRPIARERSIA